MSHVLKHIQKFKGVRVTDCNEAQLDYLAAKARMKDLQEIFRAMGVSKTKLKRISKSNNTYEVRQAMNLDKAGLTGFNFENEYMRSKDTLTQHRGALKRKIPTGLAAVVDRHSKQALWLADRLQNSIALRPAFYNCEFKAEWDGDKPNGRANLHCIIYLNEEGKVCKKYDTGYQKHEVLLPVPMNWAEQINLLRTDDDEDRSFKSSKAQHHVTIENKIIKSVEPIGMFGDVEGFQVEYYSKGLKANDWSEQEGYIAKYMGSLKLCKSRMHIKSVAKRKASAEFTTDLLGALG